ncbi:MAG: acetate kinase [Oligoflexia bacterium]|nr:acetate kinase [Oligoflexia bacterium]
MKILVINCGSSSVKFQFLHTATRERLAWGNAERIGEELSLFTYKNSKGFSKTEENIRFANHEDALRTIVNRLMDPEVGVISSEKDINGIGHRVVHGAEEFYSSVRITDEVLDVIKKFVFLAPLHNPANIIGIEVCRKLFPEHVQCGVFDTSFHHKMPKYSSLYAIPQEYYTRHHIKRYGFHGTSHRFVSSRVAQLMFRDYKRLKIITCHLGNGASVCAIKQGVSVDTSMGLTPLEGLMMGTRGGDMDPAVPLFLMETLGMSLKEVNTLLNKKSGILGVSGKCNDMRELHEFIANGDESARLALEIYCYRLKKYIGAYSAALGGLDVLVFTGGIGQNDEIVRELTCSGLAFMGIKLDRILNIDNNRKESMISSSDSKVPIYIVPTDEELLIALDTEKVIKGIPIED